MRLSKAWTAIDRLSVIWKSDLTDKRKRNFLQAAVVSIPLYGCTTWMLTKRIEKKLDDNYTRMLWAILNKSWRQYPTKQRLYGHLPPITKIIKFRRTRHAGHWWRSRDGLISDVLWTPAHGRAKAGRPARTYIHSSVKIRDIALRTCQKRWTIGRSGKRGSRISVLVAWHDVYIYIYIYIILLNTLSCGKSCLVVPGVAVPPWATETHHPWLAADEGKILHVLSHVVWWKKLFC